MRCSARDVGRFAASPKAKSMPYQHEEFDLDVRLHGIPVRHRAQADTEGEDCTLDECPEPTDPHTCDGLAQTCNTCDNTCQGHTFCDEDTCGQLQTCPPTCQAICDTQGCFTHGCDTSETCDQQKCLGVETSPPCGEEEETDDTCGCQPGPGEPPDNPD
jgi:hypothetical protein